MADRDITVWLDERWYNALIRQLEEGETLEDKLGDYLDELCNKLPQHEYESISSEIYEEAQQRQMERQAATRYSAFQITEHGETHSYEVDRGLEVLDAARLLRMYLRGERGASEFLQMLWNAQEVPAERFDELAKLRMENTGKVTGAFRMDFDRQRMEALHIMDGWKAYPMKEVSSAIYFAERKQGLDKDQRWERFLSRLEGKEVTLLSEDTPIPYLRGSRPLRPEDLSFAEEVIQNDLLLNFYVGVSFDPDAVFGTHVCTADNDDFLNIYANFDCEGNCVCDDLEVYLERANGDEEAYRYRLPDGMTEVLREKMDEYCRSTTGQTLEEMREEVLMEAQSESPESPVMM